MYRRWNRDDEVSTEIIPGKKYTPGQLDNIAGAILREDAKKELCRECGSSGTATGKSKSVTEDVEDQEGNKLTLKFDEFKCKNKHSWYSGEGKLKGIGGKDPILFEEHIQSRKRREIYVSVGVPDPSIESGIYNRCVDTQTEALTPTGWKSFDELNVGDNIWTYDINEDTCSWGKLEDIYINSDFEGDLQVLESQNISARVTEGHSWAVVQERDKTKLHKVQTSIDLEPQRVGRSNISGRFLPNEGEYKYLTLRHYIPLARLPKDINLELTGRENLFELLGWVLTDGTYRGEGKNDALVYQAMHNPKLPSLQACLRANELSDQPQFIDENNVGRWAIPVKIGRPLRALTENIKLISKVPLNTFAFSEYEALLKGIVGGDGSIFEESVTGYVKREIYSTKPLEADAIQGLCAILGIPTSNRKVENEDAFCPIEYTVGLKKSPWGYIRPALQEPEFYEGPVWCPIVSSGFWMARRKGRTYITGNTHPNGRKTNSVNQRKRHGASWYRAVVFPLILLGPKSLLVMIPIMLYTWWKNANFNRKTS